MTRNGKAFLFGLLGILFYSFMLVFMKLAYSVTPQILAFSRIVGVFLFTLPFVFKKPQLLKTERLGLHLVRVLCFFVGNFCAWYLISRKQLVNIALLSSTTPLIMPVLGYLLFKRTINKFKFFLISIGFLGVCIVINPGFAPLELHHLFALLIPLSIAFSLLCTSELSETDKTITILFYYSSLSTFISFVFMLFNMKSFASEMWPHLICILVFSTLFQLFTTRAYSMGDPSFVSPVIYFDVVFCLFFGWFIFSEAPTHLSLIGSILIISTGLYLLLHSKWRKKKTLSQQQI